MRARLRGLTAISAMRRNRPIRETIAGIRTGHWAIGTMASLPRSAKPRTTPPAAFTAEKIARRRLPGATGAIGSTWASMPWSRSDFTTTSCFQA
jgi:hypothetical protein